MVLLYGTDAMLLATRARLLELSGLETICAVRVSEVERILSSEYPQALLLCHTIPWAEQNRVLQAVVKTNPETRCLVFTNERDAPNVTMSMRGELVTGFVSPERLLELMNSLLGTRPPTGRYIMERKWQGFAAQ